VIEAERIGWAFGSKAVLSGVDLRASEGRVLGLVGPNGAGKTTLLRALYRSIRTEGSIRVDGRELAELRQHERASRLAVVVQETEGETELTVSDLVLLGRSPHLGLWQRPGEADHRIVLDSLRRVGMAALASRPFSELSGGERQRVLIAKALAQQASHLLLDEPTNHLDIRAQHDLLSLVRELAVTSVVVLHDLDLAARYCDDVVLLDRGSVAASGPVDAVMRPEVLEPVFCVPIERLDRAGRIHLLIG